MEDYDMINNVDARGLYMCMKAQLTEMTKQELKPGRAGKPGKRGSIVNISSRAGVEGVSKVRCPSMSLVMISNLTNMNLYLVWAILRCQACCHVSLRYIRRSRG